MPSPARAAPKPEKALVALGLRVHKELKLALKIAAATEERTMEEKLHVMLCHELNRPDLSLQAPDPATA